MVMMFANRVLWWAGVGLSRIGLGGLNLWLIVGALALAVLPAGAVYVYQSGKLASAVEAARSDEREACTRRVVEIERQINEEAERREAAAREAEADVSALETSKEIEAACKADKLCREHGK